MLPIKNLLLIEWSDGRHQERTPGDHAGPFSPRIGNEEQRSGFRACVDTAPSHHPLGTSLPVSIRRARGRRRGSLLRPEDTRLRRRQKEGPTKQPANNSQLTGDGDQPQVSHPASLTCTKLLCLDIFLGKERLSSAVELGRSRTCRRHMMKSCIYESKSLSWTAVSWMSRSTTCSEPNARKLYVASVSLTLFWRRSSGLTESKKLPKLFKFCDRSNRRWASKLLKHPTRATFLLKLIVTIGPSTLYVN